MNNLTKKITGAFLSSEQFRVHETEAVIDVNCVLDILKGNLAAYRIRNFLSPEACQQIVNNFWNCSEKVPRIGCGEDGVEGYFVGASHIEKTTEEYLTEANASEKAVQSLFVNTTNPASTFRETVAEKSQLTIRPAQANGFTAGNSKAVYWNSLGNFLLQPHDDLAQLSDPKQKGFEIQQTNRVLAFNFYAEVPVNAGQLKLWNIQPDDKSRAKLNLTHSGFPYPPETLNGIEDITVPVATGDICLINGNLVHAVLRGNPTASAKKRLLITFFMAFNKNQELIWWT